MSSLCLFPSRLSSRHPNSSNTPSNAGSLFPNLTTQHPMSGGILGGGSGLIGNGGGVVGSEGLSPPSLAPFPLSHIHQSSQIGNMKQDKYEKSYYGSSDPSPANSSSDGNRGSMGGNGSASPPPVSSNPENNTCRLMDYRNQAVAAFTVDGRDLICLPQAFELFLKHLVGGLHTVYTKLKRLDVVPVVCNVEQVRVLRSLGAIQPGVNRCKLISPKEFDILYEDCTNSSARPGRPPKRTGGVPVTPDSIKKQRLQMTPDYYHSTSSSLMDPKKPQFTHPYLPFSDHSQKSLMPSAGSFPYPPHLTPLNFLPFGHPGLLNLMATHLATGRSVGIDAVTSRLKRYNELRPFNLNGRKEDDHEKGDLEEERSKFERHHHASSHDDPLSNDAKHQSLKQQLPHHPIFQHPYTTHHQNLTLSRHPHFSGTGYEPSTSDRPLNLEMTKRSPQLSSSPVVSRLVVNKDIDVQSASSDDYNDVINNTNNNTAGGFLDEQKAVDQSKEDTCRNGNESEEAGDDDDDHDVGNTASGSDEDNINTSTCNGKSPTNQIPGEHLPRSSPGMVTMEMLMVNIQAMLKMIADKMREKEQQFIEEKERLRKKLKREKKARRSLEMQVNATSSSSNKSRGIPHHVIHSSPMATQLSLMRSEEAEKTSSCTKDSKSTSFVSSPRRELINNEDGDNDADDSEQIEVAEMRSKSPLLLTPTKTNSVTNHRFPISIIGNGSCSSGSPQ